MLRYLALAAAGEARAAFRRQAIAAIFFAVGAILVIIAIVFAALGARDSLAIYAALTLTQADLAVACALIVIAAILVAIGVYQRRRRIERTPLAASAILAAPVAAGALGRRFSFGTVIAVAAVVAGAYLGRQAGRR
ncbi:MAG TPA: hypothetical protein VGH40_17535 [Roseiarcus sp.]|jgi:heme/copper-type cytochrome/quinol oxidase subunit 1